ncbi:pentapeptide repeat-containing protein [Acidobacteria bacterium AH-259-O06]|nr:pentapeptide repeat-containing protein [Acidobacteria bacterium AH-259-O06]
MSDLSIYHLGRQAADFTPPYRDQDKVYGGLRLDGNTVDKAHIEHCTFSNVSFKDVTVNSGHFVDSVFIGCYFRRTQLVNSHFVGCRFFECRFARVSIQACSFRFSSFRDCQIPFDELFHSLPSEPNIREELTRNLSLASSKLGLSSEARKYRMAEIKAREEHLSAAFLGKSQWYLDHFDAVRRVRAFGQWLLSLLNRWLWGYGEKWSVLIRNLLLISLVLFPGLFYVFRNQLRHVTDRDTTFLDTIYFSLENVTPGGIVSGVIAEGNTVRFLAALESILGVIALALFASYIFRWSLHR